MTTRILIITLCMSMAWVTDLSAASRHVTDSLMKELETVLGNRPQYLMQKEARLDSLHRKVECATDTEEKFWALSELFDEYHSFNTDSAYNVALRQEGVGRATGKPELVINARLHQADVLSAIGMFHEAVEQLDRISPTQVPEYLRPYWLHINRTTYGNMAQNAVVMPEKRRYEALTDTYRDSLLALQRDDEFVSTLIRADQLTVHGHPDTAVTMLSRYISTHPLKEHERAIYAWTLSEAYAARGDIENQKEQLIISAIGDMKSANREYASLRQLAMLLYQEGDVDRAYRFLTIALEDASKSNARQRIVELSACYPTVNGIYVEMVKSQKRALMRTVVIITLLCIVMILLLVYTRKQMKRIALARRELEESNQRLNELNVKLVTYNDKLSEANAKLSEANYAIAELSKMKEFYIGQYMDQCMDYIRKLDSYRKTAGKYLTTGKIDALKELFSSSAVVDDELKLFYSQFDRTFLSLFPTFVEDFNSLLLPEEAIRPKKEGALNTELRIFALIRLGISDSDKIAKFLHYSLTTIYNYRTKVRNKAKGDRNLLEEEVMKLGKV